MHSRKFFSETVNLGLDGDGNALSSIATLMRGAGWGYELDPDTNEIDTTTFSMDAWLSDALSIIPTSTIYVGQDQYVRDAAAAGPPRLYKGVPTMGGVPFDVTEWMGHVVDPNQVWIYSPSGAQDVSIIFQGV